jgi:hypothetical protein
MSGESRGVPFGTRLRRAWRSLWQSSQRRRWPEANVSCRGCDAVMHIPPEGETFYCPCGVGMISSVGTGALRNASVVASRIAP